MFHHDRRELESLAARLGAERARVTRSRSRLARAARHAFDNKLALLAPFTAGALVGAAALHRDPKKGGRFSPSHLFATATATAGLVELAREHVLPLFADPAGRHADADSGTRTEASATARSGAPPPA